MLKEHFILSLFCFMFLGPIMIAQKNISIIPKPDHLEMRKGSFLINDQTRISYDLDNADPKEMKSYVTTMQHISTEFNRSFLRTPNVNFMPGSSSDNKIVFQIDNSIANHEAYMLEVLPNKIICSGKSNDSWFYAWQTLKQLMPVSVFLQDNSCLLPVKIPALFIKDEPVFEYRGMHLDVCRHFFSVDEVKKYIDLLAIHKMNRFHWHLTEDQGWRIEIKKYPLLTEIGGFRKETLIGHYSDRPHKFDGQRYGGFYTQEEIKDIVRYAEQRSVTIIPEIEMPGHSMAALAAYPELACSEGPFEVATKWGVFEDVYCPTEYTFNFLTDVLTEVAALFPGEYIHIGGDECPKTSWNNSDFCKDLMEKEGLVDAYELQSYFIRRIEKVLHKLGKKLIGWDEILEGGLAKSATVMSWRGTEGGIAAARMGNNVVMTPGSHCYFDHYQSDHPDEPVAIGGYTPLEKVYLYEPIPAVLSSEEGKFVLGAQGNVWTEYMKSFDHVEYMAYPRASALSEVLWTTPEQRNFYDFAERLAAHQKRLKTMEVNFAPSLFDLDASVKTVPHEGVYLELGQKLLKGDIRYTLDGSSPVKDSKVYKDAIPLNGELELVAATFEGEKQIGREIRQKFKDHKAVAAAIELETLPHEKYDSGGKMALINGVAGSNKRYGDREWLGFSGKDLVATLDLGKLQKVSEFYTRFYHGPGQWIYGPQKISIYGGVTREDMKLLATGKFDPKGQFKAVNYSLFFLPVRLKYLKVHVENFGIIPEGKQGGGHSSWLFVDELIFN